MRTGSLRRRTIIATLSMLALALGAFATVVTVRYRDGLRVQARSQLLVGAQAIRLSRGGDKFKSLVSSLALEGIGVGIGNESPTNKPQDGGDGRSTPGSNPHLLTYSEQVNLNGTVVPITLSSSEASVDNAVHRLIVTELVGAAAVLLAASLLTWLALRSALAPLQHVAAVAKRIAHGDRSQRLHPQRPDTELGQMAASFDAMVDSLDEAVTQATNSEAAMRRFLADASHELRTPIAALQATTETLLRQQPQRPERDRLEADIARGAQRLGRLVDDLLNLARLQANEPLRAESVDLVEISTALITDTQARTSARLSLTNNGPAIVIGDPDALARAVHNVLDNAIRAGGEDGHIRIEIQNSQTQVRVSVADDGPGVPRTEHERIFDGFVRLNGGSGPGTGLGLAIARAIAHQHRGDITCDDTYTGAQFTLELPAANIGNYAMTSSSESRPMS